MINPVKANPRTANPCTASASATWLQLFKGGQGLSKSRKRDRDTDSRLLGLKYNKDSGFAGLQLFDELILDDDLGIAGDVVAPQKRGVADVLIVDLEAESRWQKNAQRRENPEDTGAVRELLEIDGQANIIAILSRHALNECTGFVFGACSGRLADRLPIAILTFDGAVRWCRGCSG